MKKLMGLQSDYWKQRCTIKWVQLNQENTEYFHAKATERFRHNTIARILSLDGVVLEYHQQKVVDFLQCFKQRMGVLFPPSEVLNSHGFIQPVDNLQSLSMEFSRKEIEGVVKKLN
jgi:hypothetical protein